MTLPIFINTNCDHAFPVRKGLHDLMQIGRVPQAQLDFKVRGLSCCSKFQQVK